jgi:hypothetical protein
MLGCRRIAIPRLVDRHCDLDGGSGRRYAAAPGSAIDLDQTIERHGVPLRCASQIDNVSLVIHANGNARTIFREARKTIDHS